MKRFLLLFLLLISSVVFSNERFYSDSEKTEMLFAEFNENLVKISQEIHQLNEALSKIASIAEEYRVEKRTNYPDFTPWND